MILLVNQFECRLPFTALIKLNVFNFDSNSSLCQHRILEQQAVFLFVVRLNLRQFRLQQGHLCLRVGQRQFQLPILCGHLIQLQPGLLVPASLLFLTKPIFQFLKESQMHLQLCDLRFQFELQLAFLRFELVLRFLFGGGHNALNLLAVDSLVISWN